MLPEPLHCRVCGLCFKKTTFALLVMYACNDIIKLFFFPSLKRKLAKRSPKKFKKKKVPHGIEYIVFFSHHSIIGRKTNVPHPISLFVKNILPLCSEVKIPHFCPSMN